MPDARDTRVRRFVQTLSRLRVVIPVMLVPALVAALVVVPSGSAVASTGDVTITGHGNGHGRGMGQYGAYGYAVDQSWSYTQILQHYYGGTSLANNAGNPGVGVELTRMTAVDTVVTAPALMVNGAPVGTAALLVRRVGAGTFAVFTGPGCGGPWTQPSTLGSGLTISTGADPSQLTNLLRVCEQSTTHGYRGTLSVVDPGGTQYVINTLPSESYLRGVVPRESPASWGSAGGGRGMNALDAQAVAARSYALSGAVRTSGAMTCDTTACQVYDGAYVWAYGGSMTPLDSPNSDLAVAQTAGMVMRAANGTIARTEFSASTGGYTAGGTFPAVPDDGDATSINPYHSWTTVLSLDAVASALGTGPIRAINVTGRNGLGADGGRATQVTVLTVAGQTRTFTGASVRSALNLNSDWFSLSAISTAEAQAVVQALYVDILGRGVDPAGLQTWTAEVMRSGGAATTAAALSTSQERLQAMVTAQYVQALHRGPDANGLAFWTALLQNGWSLPDVQVGIYSSDESLLTLGGGSTTVWVAAMYQAILGRGAAPSEAQWWADYASRYGRQAAVGGIARSTEAAGRRLTGYYQTMLGRDVDPAGQATFMPILMTGRGDLTLPALLGGSAEYWNRAQTRY